MARTDRCYNVTTDGVKYHIPGCWGCVIYGHERCTCQRPSEKSIEEKMDMLERRVTELERERKHWERVAREARDLPK